MQPFRVVVSNIVLKLKFQCKRFQVGALEVPIWTLDSDIVQQACPENEEDLKCMKFSARSQLAVCNRYLQTQAFASRATHTVF